MLFGSAARGGFDEHSDVDIYVLLKNPGKFTRAGFIENSIKTDVIFDTPEIAKKYLNSDKNNLKRNTSHMLAYGKILFERNYSLKKLQNIAKNNLKGKTKYKASEILMHKYSIDDLWDDVQRDIKNKNYLAFGIDSAILINNILELFLKLKGEFIRQPKDMIKVIKKLDKKLAEGMENFYKEPSVQNKKLALSKLIDYTYKKCGGKIPDKWVLKNLKK